MTGRHYLNLYRGFEPQPLVGPGLLRLGLALLVLLLALGGYSFWLLTQVRGLEQTVAELAANSSLRQKELVAASLRLKQDGDAPLQAMEQQRRLRARLLKALGQGELGRLDGYAAYLDALAHQAGGEVWLTAFEVGLGKDGAQDKLALALAGRGKSPRAVADYLNRLKQEKVFQGLGFGALELSQPEAVEANNTEGKSAKSDKKALVGVAFTLGKFTDAQGRGAP